MTAIRFHQRSHPIVLSKESYAAAARAARNAIPGLIAKGYHKLASHLAGRADEFEERAA
jgi:hypothetical protein